ncbi:MAG: hypothetical protein LBQ24_02705 [Candidatus Peribacteria bacterium]|nr:hypothetical protein [Candidatus Peribacteria bacterium]
MKQEIKDLKNEIKNEYAKKYVELQLEEQKRRVRKLEDWQLKAITIATLFASLF